MQQLYELNVRTWRTERSFELGRPATLDDLPDTVLDQLVEHGFSWIYLIGVWPTGPLAREVSLRDQHLRTYLSGVLPNFHDDDVCGSPFMPESYSVDAARGGDAALARLRERARGAGISLMLDFIPNHVGLDHAWLRDHPDYGIQGDEERLAAQPDAWCRLHGRVFAHGRDPFFAPWKNSVQLDYSNPRLQEAMTQVASSIAARCDGLRCDLAMLLLKDVFENTWKRPMQPFWRKCLDRVRAASTNSSRPASISPSTRSSTTACYRATRNPSAPTCGPRATTRSTVCASWKTTRNSARQRVLPPPIITVARC